MVANPMKTVLPGLLCLFGGALLPLAFAPFNYWPLAVAAITLLFYCALKCGPRQGFLRGYLFGLGMFGVGVNWLHISINQFGGMNLIGSLLVTMALVLYLALYPGLAILAGIRCFARHGPFRQLFAFAILWVLCEWLRAWVFTGFPWLQVGYALIDSPLAGLAPLIGTYGIGLALTSSVALLVAAAAPATIWRRVGALVLFGNLWLGAWVLEDIEWTAPAGRDISVALVQGGIPQDMKWQPQFQRQGFDRYLELSEPYWQHDLIIWPETALPVLLSRSEAYLDEIEHRRIQGRAILLLGMPVDDPATREFFNSALLLADDIAVYHKRHLVPFGEYLPMKSMLGRLLDFLRIPMSDFSSGKPVSPVFVNGKFKAGISICYEATFGREIIKALPEAEFLINISNDAWFGDSLAPHQHLQMARMRALETGRYLLRATNTGITAIIDNEGSVIRRAEQFLPTAISGSVKPYAGMTPYALSGDLPAIGLCIVILLALFFVRSGRS